MTTHFIAIGGVQCTTSISITHKGYKVTGSDDFEPSQSRLDKRNVAFRNGLVSKNYK
jgi:UDP-N-acetylmuramate-alanine ligase